MESRWESRRGFLKVVGGVVDKGSIVRERAGIVKKLKLIAVKFNC